MQLARTKVAVNYHGADAVKLRHLGDLWMQGDDVTVDPRTATVQIMVNTSERVLNASQIL